MKIIVTSVLLLMSVVCFSQKKYTATDSARAQQYFKKSFAYHIFSAKHQLYLDSALMLIPTHDYYWQQKSMPLYKTQKYQLGKPFLDSAVKYNATRWLDYRAFMQCIFEKNYTEALAGFRLSKNVLGNKTVMDHPYDFYIGLCHLQLNNVDSSQYYFDKCIADTKSKLGESWVHYMHLFYRGITAFELEQYEQAITYFDKAIAIYKNFSDAQYYKAVCLVRLNKWQEAAPVAAMAKDNYDKQTTINEDNAIYEYYPYQLRIFNASTLVKQITEKLKG